MKSEIFTKFHGEINGVEFTDQYLFNLTSELLRIVEGHKKTPVESAEYTEYVRDRAELWLLQYKTPYELKNNLVAFLKFEIPFELFNQFDKKFNEFVIK